MKKILLVNLSSVSQSSIMSEYEGRVAPMGLLYIAAVLEKNHVVKVYDENVCSSDILRVIKEFKPDFVAISAYYSFQFPRAVKVAKSIKIHNPDIIISIALLIKSYHSLAMVVLKVTRGIPSISVKYALAISRSNKSTAIVALTPSVSH